MEKKKRGKTVAGEFSDSETSVPYNFVGRFDVIVRILCLQKMCVCLCVYVFLCMCDCVVGTGD